MTWFKRIRYSGIEGVVIYGDTNPKHVDAYNRIKPVLDRKFAQLDHVQKLLMFRLLSCREMSDGFAENTSAYPVSVHSSVLARMTTLPPSSVEIAMRGLHTLGLIEGIDPHWGIIDEPSYHRFPSISANRRRSLSNKIRATVLAVGRCMRCGRTERLSVDHIIPVKRGGSDDLSNLQCLCLFCNCAKRDRYIG